MFEFAFVVYCIVLFCCFPSTVCLDDCARLAGNGVCDVSLLLETVRTHTHTHTHTPIYPYAYIHAYSIANTHTHTHLSTHMLTYTHIQLQTHTHTHTQSQCYTEGCNYDGGDCSIRPLGDGDLWAQCPECREKFNNGQCDVECNRAECYHDGQDCEPKCPHVEECMQFMEDGECSTKCITQQCPFDYVDCQGKPRFVSL